MRFLLTALARHERPLIVVSSFFGTQEGKFSMSLESIKAVSHAPPPSYAQTADSDLSKVEKGQSMQDDSEGPMAPGFWRRIRPGVAVLLLTLVMLVGLGASHCK